MSEQEQVTCIFRHGTPEDPITTLYGVQPMPVEDLPKHCRCGAELHHAARVVFINPGEED